MSDKETDRHLQIKKKLPSINRFIEEGFFCYFGVWAHDSLVFVTGCTQKVQLLLDLQNLTQVFRVIHQIIVVFIHKFWHQGI